MPEQNYNPNNRERVLRSRTVIVERKEFELELRANQRGEFLRVTEYHAGRRNCVIIPSSGLTDFIHAIGDVVG